jgi:hypothetical protein
MPGQHHQGFSAAEDHTEAGARRVPSGTAVSFTGHGGLCSGCRRSMHTAPPGAARPPDHVWVLSDSNSWHASCYLRRP